MSRPPGPGTEAPRDFRLILVDGNNLLHRMHGSAHRAHQRPLLARLSAAVPAEVEAIVLLDGRPDPGGLDRGRLRRGLEVRHSGGVDADTVLVELVAARSFTERATVVVVTDDRALTERVRQLGGRTKRLDWLIGSLIDEGPSRSAPAAGRNARPLARPQRAGDERRGGMSDEEGGEERPPWRPGRGATRKVGNPRRGPGGAGRGDRGGGRGPSL